MPDQLQIGLRNSSIRDPSIALFLPVDFLFRLHISRVLVSYDYLLLPDVLSNIAGFWHNHVQDFLGRAVKLYFLNLVGNTHSPLAKQT